MHKESESESECILGISDDGSVADTFIAGAGNFNSENMFLPVGERYAWQQRCPNQNC